jgi:hypothetical protein
LAPLDDVFGWSLDAEAHCVIDAILRDAVRDPVGPEFMAPPAGRQNSNGARRRDGEEARQTQPSRDSAP